MKKFSWLLVLSSAIIALPSCEKVIGEGPVITENRNVTSFDRLLLAIDAEAYFTQSNTVSLEIDAQRNILDEIEAVVINNELKIRFRHPNVRIKNGERVVVRVSGPEVKNVEVSGSGDLDIEQPNAPAEVKFFVSGSGSIVADKAGISYNESTVSGSGKITVLQGSSNSEKINISGSGYVDMLGVQVKEVNSHISGSGTAKVWVTDKLDVHISGSGTVYYKGNPAISSSISGSGSVVKL